MLPSTNLRRVPNYIGKLIEARAQDKTAEPS